MRQILDSPQFKAATAFIEKDQPRFVKETHRAHRDPVPAVQGSSAAPRSYLEMLRAVGSHRRRDGPGRQRHGARKGSGGAGLVAIVAHLDTVFPEGTDVKVKRAGTKLSAPGIGDNTRGAALMLAVIRAMQAAKFQTASDILFVGNVGEEGEGDLRGVKFLMQKGKYKDRITQFIAIDGGGQAHDHARRRRQPALPRHVQRARRSQLRRVRPGQSGLRDGQRHREVLAGEGAAGAEDHLQRRPRERRHLGELDPVRDRRW